MALLSLKLVSCTGENGSGEANFNETVTVEATQLRTGSLPLVYRTTGEMRARNQVDIHPEINATVTEIRVNDGDRVSEGDTLLRLRDTPFREQLNQAEHDYRIANARLRQSEAELRRLQAQYERTKQLAERELETDLELETVQANIDAAEASVELAGSQKERAASEVEEQRSNLENTVVRAPIDGVVGNRDAEVGQHVNTNQRLFQIGDIDNMRIHVLLTENMSHSITPGNRAELVSAGNDNNPVTATVERISPFLDPITHTTIAQLQVDQNAEYLRPGMFVTVDIFYGETEQTSLVPKTALYDHPTKGRTGIYVADMTSLQHELDLESDIEEEIQNMTPNPVPVEFVSVDILAEGRGMAGVSGLEDHKAWVVTLGQHQLAEWESDRAFVRMVNLDFVMELQNRQTRDMESIIFSNND